MRRLLRLSLLPFVLLLSVAAQAELKFSIAYPSSAFAGPFSGRVVVYLNQPGEDEPRFGPDWFHPSPMYSAMFKNVMPGQEMVISDSNVVGFPGKISSLPAGDYQVQAVVDRDLGGRAVGSSAGNLDSTVAKMHLDPTDSVVEHIVCDQVIPQPKFADTKFTQALEVSSTLLTDFYGRPTSVKGAVILPRDYFDNPSKKYPTIYLIPGFGGDYMQLSGFNEGSSQKDGVSFITVFLDPNVPTGHSVFADSANNGPWGKALTTEFIPAFESKYRAIPDERARFVTGHSSGGWSSLWLQVAYPDVFGGVWSTSPDPVDFHAFQLIDIYKPGANMFTDANGKPIALAREGDTPVIFYKQFSDMERPIRGEQLGSFEAVFSPRGDNGQPEKLWNRDTGAIDPDVAKAWRKYDIALKLRTEWPTLGPKLKGKLHVWCGNMDTFYLDPAVRLLQKEMKELGSDAEVEMVPGDHGTMMTPELHAKIDKEMADQFTASGLGR